METINKKDIAVFLQQSKLADQFEDEIIVPKKYILNEINITNNTSFNKIMDILRFYIVKELPYEIYDYVLEHNPDLSDFKDFFFDELTLLQNTKKEKLMNECAKNGYLGLMKYLHVNGYSWDEWTCVNAAEHGRLNCLKYLYMNGGKCNSWTCKQAAMNVSSLKRYGDLQDHLGCLKYLHENKCCWNDYTGKYDGIDKVISVYDMYGVVANMTSSKQSKKQRSQDHLACLKYLHEIGCDWTPNTDETDEGHEYTFLCNAAALVGDLDCLKYLHENGCYWDYTALGEAANGGNIDCLKYAHLKMLEEATNDDKKDTNYPWGDYGYACWMAVATCRDNIDCLKYAYENGCPMTSSTCLFAAKYNHFNSLKYAHENGALLDDRHYHFAIERDSIECFKYLHENGCHWTKKTCETAASRGSIKCFKYLHENGCHWTKKTCETAASRGSIKCLKYAIENGCSFDKQMCIEQATMHNRNHKHIIEYLESLT